MTEWTYCGISRASGSPPSTGRAGTPWLSVRSSMSPSNMDAREDIAERVETFGFIGNLLVSDRMCIPRASGTAAMDSDLVLATVKVTDRSVDDHVSDHVNDVDPDRPGRRRDARMDRCRDRGRTREHLATDHPDRRPCSGPRANPR